MTDVLIIGSGMAGIACARRLAGEGLSVLVLDKGRGIGGRVATRRVEGWQFDHGAQYVTAQGPDFAEALAGIGPAASWDDGGRAVLVGAPGMSALPKALAEGLTIRQGVQVTGVRRAGAGWRVETASEVFHAPRVVLTVPAPQVAGLIGDHPLAAELSPVRLAPCLALMAAVDAPAPFRTRRAPDEDLAWIALDSSKPDRPDGALWVAQAGEAFSRAHLEASPEEIVARMLPLLLDRIGATPDRVLHASAHRWRYARVTEALGRPFLGQDGLYLGGDWCIGPRVEAAWTSGLAIAGAILSSRSPA